MTRQRVSVFQKDPSATERIGMEVDREGIHQVLEQLTTAGYWVRGIDEPPALRSADDVLDKMYQGARSHGYLMALMGAWVEVR